MPIEPPQESLELLASQCGIISRGQSGAAGLATTTMDNRLRCGRWHSVQRGVYATFTGTPAREAELWAALLRAGPDAVLSHQTAAERHGLLNQPSESVHITVPASRHPARWSKIPGIVIHRSGSITRTRHPAMSPPCTRLEETVLDLIQASGTFDEAYVWICRAVGRRRTTAERLRHALDARKRFRWRRETELALGDADQGVLSWLERQYVRGVERPHGLPPAQRQVRVRQKTGSRYLDALYERYLLCVELDGTASHPADEQWRDKRRDNWNLVWGNIVTLRYGFLDLRDSEHCCATARDIAQLLRSRGLPTPHPCTRLGCPV